MRRLKAAIARIQDQLLVRGDQARLRCATLSWLPGHRLVAIEDLGIPGQNEQFAIESPGGALHVLNWTNEPIYQLLDRSAPDFSDESVMLYCRFFNHWVRGQLGRFQMVEHLEQIHWTDGASDKVRRRVRRKLLPLTIVDRSADDHIRLTGTVIFKNALFRTDFIVATRETDTKDSESGELEHLTRGQWRLSNEDLLIEDLPVDIPDPPGPLG